MGTPRKKGTVSFLSGGDIIHLCYYPCIL